MTNTMNKKNNKIMLMTVAFLLLFTAIPVKAQDMQDESAVSGNGLGIDDQTQGTGVVEGEDSVNPLGAMNLKKYYELKNAWDGKVEGVDYINFTVPDAGLWWYDQSFARGELFEAFQKARMDEDNWWYCTNQPGQQVTTEKVPEPVEFEYDYELERCAMQRVLEVTFVDDHYRPDGISCDEVFLDLNSPYQYAAFTNELNSAVTILGQSAEQIVDMYMEAYSDEVMCYGRQGHRRAIIGAENCSKAYRIGIGVIRTRAVEAKVLKYILQFLLQMMTGMFRYSAKKVFG